MRLSAPERRRRILDAAVEAFAERGYHGTSVGEIATAAGITKPVLYDHFRSKEELFVEAMEGVRGQLLARGAEAMSEHADREAGIRAAVDSFFAYVEEHPAAVRVLLVAPRGAPEMVDAARRVQDEATAAIGELVGAGPLHTEFMKQGIHGLAEWWGAHPQTPRAELVEAVMDIAWKGLGDRG
jgi:AcrR family transcriptional regulator